MRFFLISERMLDLIYFKSWTIALVSNLFELWIHLGQSIIHFRVIFELEHLLFEQVKLLIKFNFSLFSVIMALFLYSLSNILNSILHFHHHIFMFSHFCFTNIFDFFYFIFNLIFIHFSFKLSFNVTFLNEIAYLSLDPVSIG